MPSTTYVYIFFLLLRRPPSATLFPTRRSSDLQVVKNRNDRSDLTGRIEDFASRELHRQPAATVRIDQLDLDRKSTRLNSSHLVISYAVFCLKKKNKPETKISITQIGYNSHRHK